MMPVRPDRFLPVDDDASTLGLGLILKNDIENISIDIQIFAKNSLLSKIFCILQHAYLVNLVVDLVDLIKFFGVVHFLFSIFQH